MEIAHFMAHDSLLVFVEPYSDGVIEADRFIDFRELQHI